MAKMNLVALIINLSPAPPPSLAEKYSKNGTITEETEEKKYNRKCKHQNRSEKRAFAKSEF